MNIKRNESEVEIPTSSMADIAFLLIVFFMVTSAFAATRGLDYLLPPKVDVPENIEPEEAVHIKILADTSILIDGDYYELDEIQSYLKPKLERNPEKPILLQTEMDAPYYRMVDVLDQLKKVSEPVEKGGLGIPMKHLSIPTNKEFMEIMERMGLE